VALPLGATVNARAEYLDSLGQQRLEITAHIAALYKKRDVVDIHIAEAMRGLDEFQSTTLVIRPKDFRRRAMSPSKRRALRRVQAYLF
jgi:hypothetical protein